MDYTTVYAIANDSIGLRHPLTGLGMILLGAVARWRFRKSGLFAYVFMGFGAIFVLGAGVLPWWDYRRVTQAVSGGLAKQVEGPIHGWQVVHGKPLSKSSRFHGHYEWFSVGQVDFRVEWNSLEAGFANRGSTEGHPSVALSDGRAARIWYVPIDGPGQPPRIVRIDLAPSGWAASGSLGVGTSASFVQSHISDDAGILSALQIAGIDARLSGFEMMTGHRLVIVTIPSLDGKDIARYATDLANHLDIGQREKNDGILLLVAPRERQARIAVGRGLASRLSDVDCEEIMAMVMVPQFQRGDFPRGIDAGAAAIISKVMSEERK